MNDHILKDLNEDQLKAVTTIDGPVLIVAGAGTGKTKVITHRIAYLIKTFPHLSPSNFLAVTFSRKAANEMLSRVEDLIGEHKDELWISTFHSFCRRILEDHALDIGLSKDFRLLDRTEQWIFFESIISDIDLKYYSNMADPFSPIDNFIRFISRCKDELVSPDEYAAYANGIKEKEERAHQKEAALIYKEYQKRMAMANCLDFGDLIIFAIKMFQKRPSILSKYRQQFHYILVDEFQDTNVAQIELISMLANERRNICVVGDDDQGIYRFRGASYASFVKFREKFPKHTFLKLTQNYRSTKKILSVSESLIKNNNPDRYDPDKNLWTKNKTGDSVEVLSTNEYEAEAQSIIDRICRMYEEAQDYSKIAVLYRAHSHNQELIKRLKKEGIPYAVVGPIGLFEREEIKDIVAVLSVLNNTADNVSLFRMLCLPHIGMDLNEVIELSRLAREQGVALYKVIKDPKIKEHIAKDSYAKLEEFIKLLKHLILVSGKLDIEKLFYEIIEKTGYIKDWVANLNREYEISLSNVGKFYKLIGNYIRGHEHVMLRDFMEYLESYLRAGGDISQQNEILGDTSGVQLMTVHQAKGLEFPYVFVIGLVQNRFPTRPRPDAVPFPVELMKEQLPKGNFHLQEERRLFYVAITRAKERLFISTVNKPYHRESVFLNEICLEGSKENFCRICPEYEKTDLECRVRLGLSKKDILVMQAKRKISDAIKKLESSPDIKNDLEEIVFKEIEREYRDLANNLKAVKDEKYDELSLSETFINFPADLKLSYTQLDTFISCPLKYKFNYIYNIPPRLTAPLSFGSVMHDTLEEFYRQIMDGKKPTLETLDAIYESHWDSSGYVNKIQEMQYKRNGSRILKEFYKSNEENLRPPLYIEEEFLIKIGGCQFKGFIDRIDELPDGGVEIIDYKTGKMRHRNTFQKSVQLDLYAIACREVLGLEPKLLSFYYLQDNEKVSAVRELQDLEKTKESIASIIDQIKARRFTPTPGRICSRCDYRIICPAAKL